MSLRQSLRLTLLTMFSSAVCGCATPLYQRVEGLRVGMDKATVLDMAGNPQRTHRRGGQDLWIYDYYRNERKMERGVRIENGHVIALGAEVATESKGPLAEDPILRDYDELVKQAKVKEKTGFREQ